MATIKEQAAAIKGYAAEIDAAIVAKGGTTQGGLRNAAGAIAAIPTGPTPPKQWWEDEDLTVIEITLYARDTTFKDSSAFPSGTKIWWDCTKGAESYVTKASSTAIEHDYGAAGAYLVAFSNSTSSLQGAFVDNLKVSGLKKIASGVKNMYACFRGCRCMVGDIPSLKDVTVSLTDAFKDTSISPKIVYFPDNSVSASNSLVSIASTGTLEINGKCASLRIGNTPINKLVAPDLEYCPLLQGADRLVECIVPNATAFENNGIYSASRLSHAKFGVLTSLGGVVFHNIGSSLIADAQGFKSIVEVGNTCESLMGLASFPASAPTTTKFECADGYVAYIGGAWTAVTEG